MRRSRDYDAHPQVRRELIEVLDVLDARVDHLQPMLSTSPHVPLHLHARYTRIEIQAAFNDGASLRPPRWDSGVKWLPHEQTDIFAFTLDKTSGEFSPTTRYQDYAISPELIHWESQSTTSVASPTGQRYLHHQERGSDGRAVRPSTSRRARLLVSRARPRTYDMSETVQSPSPGDCVIASPPTCTPRSRRRLHRARGDRCRAKVGDTGGYEGAQPFVPAPMSTRPGQGCDAGRRADSCQAPARPWSP